MYFFFFKKMTEVFRLALHVALQRINGFEAVYAAGALCGVT